jgi:hypothetical protein
LYNVSAAQFKPTPKCYRPFDELIAYYTIFKLSIILSTGHIKLPSLANFNAFSPPLPLTIVFLIAAKII